MCLGAILGLSHPLAAEVVFDTKDELNRHLRALAAYEQTCLNPAPDFSAAAEHLAEHGVMPDGPGGFTDAGRVVMAMVENDGTSERVCTVFLTGGNLQYFVEKFPTLIREHWAEGSFRVISRESRGAPPVFMQKHPGTLVNLSAGVGDLDGQGVMLNMVATGPLGFE